MFVFVFLRGGSNMWQLKSKMNIHIQVRDGETKRRWVGMIFWIEHKLVSWKSFGHKIFWTHLFDKLRSWRLQICHSAGHSWHSCRLYKKGFICFSYLKVSHIKVVDDAQMTRDMRIKDELVSRWKTHLPKRGFPYLIPGHHHPPVQLCSSHKSIAAIYAI